MNPDLIPVREILVAVAPTLGVLVGAVPIIGGAVLVVRHALAFVRERRYIPESWRIAMEENEALRKEREVTIADILDVKRFLSSSGSETLMEAARRSLLEAERYGVAMLEIERGRSRQEKADMLAEFARRQVSMEAALTDEKARVAILDRAHADIREKIRAEDLDCRCEACKLRERVHAGVARGMRNEDEFNREFNRHRIGR